MFAMRENMASVKVVIWAMAQGRLRIRTTKTVRILGTKVMVISLIWVAAWKTLMARPTSMPAMSIGPETKITVRMAYWPISMTDYAVMVATPLRLLEGLDEGFDDQEPPVDEDEEQDLEG